MEEPLKPKITFSYPEDPLPTEKFTSQKKLKG
jgi:hypothetical protein